MCTALSFKTKDSYFGRTLDIDRSYGEEVSVVPRRFVLEFKTAGVIAEHYAMMGMAAIVGGVPLFYDAVNEHGLAAAGLNFPGNACYAPVKDACDNIAPFEFIPWILGQCKSVKEARALLSRINIADIAFSKELPPAPLHWMLSDGSEDIAVEAMRDGLHIHENPCGVLTNNPPFEYQLRNLRKYKDLRNDNSGAVRDYTLPYSAYSQGLGAVGLPGDVSSMSRFVRASFLRENSVSEGDENSSVSQFFHILSGVEMVRGACLTDEGTLDFTLYTSCMNLTRGRYYYTAYTNRRLSCIDMHKTDLNLSELSRFPLRTNEDVFSSAES